MHHHQPQSYHAWGSNIPFGFPLTPIRAENSVDFHRFELQIDCPGGLALIGVRGKPNGILDPRA